MTEVYRIGLKLPDMDLLFQSLDICIKENALRIADEMVAKGYNIKLYLVSEGAATEVPLSFRGKKLV